MAVGKLAPRSAKKEMLGSDSPATAAQHKAWSYWFVDGLPNLLAGLLCLLISGTIIAVLKYRHTHSVSLMVLILFVFVIYGAMYVCLRQILEWLKVKITYPRTGYAAPPYFTENAGAPAELTMLNLSRTSEKQSVMSALMRKDVRLRVGFSLAVLLAAAVAVRYVTNLPLCAVAGLAGGVAIWLAARRDPQRSWAVVSGLFFAQVFVFDFGDAYIGGAAYFTAGVGFVLTLAGAIVLGRYLRHNPVARA